jgi:hypothetical protein
MQEIMKLNFILTPEDVIHFNRYHLRQTTGLIRRLFPYLIFLGFLIYVVYQSWNNFTWATALIIFITAFLFFMLIMGNQLLLRWHVKKIIKGNPSLTGRREIEIDNGMLYYRFNNKENQYSINDLVRIYENKHAIYIFDNRSYAIIVPQHAFHSPQEKENFLVNVQAT